MKFNELQKKIENIYSEYHSPHFLTMDPLLCVRKFSEPAQQEIVGLLAASLAYGRVEQIIKSVELILSEMGDNPDLMVRQTLYSQKKKAFSGFKHRFNVGDDIAVLFESIRCILDTYGSLESLFLQGLEKYGYSQKHAVEYFVKTLKNATGGGKSRSRSFEFLLPQPESGSACKRLNMYFRWMVRPDDGIDLGVWKRVSPSLLIIPVDTHIMNVAKSFTMTKRNTADWKTAEEITSVLRTIDRDDPVKYDFSLCRYGMINFRKGFAVG
jgi:uncharacterized protein (TIGR02757 family)